MTNSEKMFDANVITEKMIWLPGVAASHNDDFRDFCEDGLDNQKELFAALPWLKDVLEESSDDLETVLGEFSWKKCNGFLVQLATPVPTEFHGSGYSFSWGYTQLRWFYFETLDALVERAQQFKEEVVEAERTRAAKPKRQKAKA